MKEYTLIIKGEMDFIILSPQVLSSLITQIHNSPERKVVVSIESIMPPKFTDYLLRVINSNRFSNERFRYRYILENPVTKKGITYWIWSRSNFISLLFTTSFGLSSPAIRISFRLEQQISTKISRISSKESLSRG